MEIIKTILIPVYFVIALAVIILTLIQTKDDAGLSSTITGSSTNNFFEKNKGKTKEVIVKIIPNEQKINLNWSLSPTKEKTMDDKHPVIIHKAPIICK